MNNIAFATGSRADYGIVRRYLSELNNNPEVNLEILVTGALLDAKFGSQVSLIKSDGFKIGCQVKLPIDTSCDKGITHSMAVCLDGFADLFSKRKYDLLILLGDRYEILPIAIAAAMARIAILHIHGGEATWNNYDEFIRNAITKMSLFHFTATDIYRHRVIQLGESPDRVFYMGALGAENCRYIDNANVAETVKTLPEKKYFVVLFHPETLLNNVQNQIQNLLNALNNFKEYQFVFIGSNADTHSEIIRSSIQSYINVHNNCVYYENLHTDAYHYLLKNSICLIGNSSSGIIEAPSLGIYTINIGNRQRGRVKGNSVINVECDSVKIVDAINHVLKMNTNSFIIDNPYYRPNACSNYYKKTLEILDVIHSNPQILLKPFYDVEFVLPSNNN